MIVAKFGGTAVTPRNLINVKRIVTSAHRAVVVSAVGKEYKEDVKVTDLLLNYYESRDERIWTQIADKYRRLAYVNAIEADVEDLIDDAHNRAQRFDKMYCASLGEELSARLVAAFLGAKYIESQDGVRFFANGELNQAETFVNLQRLFDGVSCGVMGGFYGGCVEGRRTFSRGGGDVSGAIVAAALNASLYENWTDVNGVCVADPTKVHNVTTVKGMSYGEMRLLSLAGAEVLHPDAVAPCEQRAIPIRIGNFFNPDGASTVISFCPSFESLLSVAENKTADGFVTTVLHSYPYWQIVRSVSRFLKEQTEKLSFFGRERYVDPDISVKFSAGRVRLYSTCSILVPLCKSLGLR